MLLIDELLTQVGHKVVTVLASDIRNAPTTVFGSVNASGALAESLRFEVSDGTLRVYCLDYIYYLEAGRKPNKDQSKEAIRKWVGWAGSTFIDQWVKDKGVLANPFAVAYKIATQGTTIHLQGGSKLVSNVINAELIDTLKSDIARDLATEIVESFRSDVLKIAA